MLQIVKNPFTFFIEYPFVYRYTIQVSEKAAKSCDSISTQMGKLFYVFDFPIVLNNEILETFSIGPDSKAETGELAGDNIK